jgi:hypothetical protein
VLVRICDLEPDFPDHINVKAANARGIKIGHTPGVLSDAGEPLLAVACFEPVLIA